MLPEIEYVKIEPVEVELVAEVDRALQITTNARIFLTGDTAGLEASPSEVNFTYRLPASMQNDSALANIIITGEVTAEGRTGGECPLQAQGLPAFITSYEMYPKRATLVERTAQED